MYKGRFLHAIGRIVDWMGTRREEIYFLLMLVNILIAIGFGIYIFNFYKDNPMFSQPLTILEHFARPIFIAMVSTTLVVIFGTFLIQLITLVSFRRVSF